MRVISGQAKGRKLKRAPGDTTRPIMDRVKESLFNILNEQVVGKRWLDLFAGTGQVGIEALSRGATAVVFIDTAREAIHIIHANLKHTQLTAGATVLRQDALAYLRHFSGPAFDLIYVAPPQYKGIWLEALQLLDERPLTFLTGTGAIVVQIDPREYQAVELKNLQLYDQRRYGSTMLCFYEPTPTLPV
jgi:16S rRNA (guanine966-N2)-methyltransferase